MVEPDASDQTVGAVLLQLCNEKLHPLVYFSKNHAPTKRIYPAYEKEFLEIFKACQKQRCLDN